VPSVYIFVAVVLQLFGDWLVTHMNCGQTDEWVKMLLSLGLVWGLGSPQNLDFCAFFVGC